MRESLLSPCITVLPLDSLLSTIIVMPEPEIQVRCEPASDTDLSSDSPPTPSPSPTSASSSETEKRKSTPPTPSFTPRKRRKSEEDILVRESSRLHPAEEITSQERELRRAEAAILFPKYAAKFNAKHTKSNQRVSSQVQDLGYLPDSEYRGQEQQDFLCMPNLQGTQLAKIQQYFKDNCQFAGERKYKKTPVRTEPFDEEKWEEDLQNRIRPSFIEPPPPESLDNQPMFGRKKTQDPTDQCKMDSFIMALKQAMGDDYIDLNDLRYYPRSDGRVYTFKLRGSKKEKQMKNGHLDVTTFLRNREIKRELEVIKNNRAMNGLPWDDAIEEEHEREIIRYVNPRTVCRGRTYDSIQHDLGVQNDRYSPPELLNREAIIPPAGMEEEGLGKTYYWSDREGGMVTIGEERGRLSQLERKSEKGNESPGKRIRKPKSTFGE